MCRLLPLALIILLPGITKAATVSGVLVGGGGIDDMSLIVKAKNGQLVEAYCNRHCENWFEEDENGEVLRSEFLGRRLRIKYTFEFNQDRVAGPGADEKFNFIKKIEFLP